MGLFDDAFAVGQSTLRHYFSQDVTVNEPGQSASTEKAAVYAATAEDADGEMGRRSRVVTRDIYLYDRSSLRHDATITIDGTTWAVDRILDTTAQGVRARLRRTSVTEGGHQQWRGRP